ncbi:MAG: YkgJ family cysteine cluster protein [Desulfobacteraceae bacterium]|nr:MAG: YkgJ family cysteine cluster protein [Desulfobacteraceae bacterium]
MNPGRNDDNRSAIMIWTGERMECSARAARENRHIREGERFSFQCHSGLPCFTACCRKADMYLYPYDIIRLKNRLGITSGEFLERYTFTAIRENPYFPNVMLKMSDQDDGACFFLSKDGCRVYEDRPFSCRAYPMERGVSTLDRMGNRDVHHFIAVHSYCRGHNTINDWTVNDWIDNQEIQPFIEMNDPWADLDGIFRTNPWGEQGLNARSFKMAFMASYNMDTFKAFIFNSSFLDRFSLSEKRMAELQNSETELLRLGFQWITFFLTGKGPLGDRS